MTLAEKKTWIVLFDGEQIGPFNSEDACYAFAAKVSRKANDWTPVCLTSPAAVEAHA